MPVLFRLQKCLVTGIGITSGAILLNYRLLHNHDRKVFASLTTNSVPEGKWNFNWDLREPASLVKPRKGDKPVDDNEYNEQLEKQKSRAVRNIILIRHGQYNLKGKADNERVLTELGQRQAMLTGKRLEALNFPYTKMVRSTMIRAQQTGEFIAESLPKSLTVVDDPLLEEGAPILPEPPLRGWKPEAHSFYQDQPRLEAAFRKYFFRAPADQTEDSYDVLVCHGNVIRYFVCRALQFPSEAWLRFAIVHASITWLSIYPEGQVILQCYSDAGHMPLDALTTS